MDIFLRKRKKIIIASIIMALCCIAMILFPDVALSSARRSISLWMSNLLPALLPFFICSNFLQYIGVMNCFSHRIFPFVMSVLSGYPMGGKIIGDLQRSGEISRNQAKLLISYCNTSGPSFMVGAVGVSMLGSSLYGIIIAAAHYIGAILNGVIFSVILSRRGALKSCSPQHSAKHTPHLPAIGIQDAFSDAIIYAFKSLGIILAYIILFTFAIDMTYRIGAFNLLPTGLPAALVKGLMEMTVGCEAVSNLPATTDAIKVTLCSVIMGWGGMSVLGQVCSMMSGTGIRASHIVATKFTHSIIAGVIALILTCLVI